MKRLKVIGLMSGTSADGIDAALVEIWEEASRLKLKLLGEGTWPYPEEVRKEIAAASQPAFSRVDRLCQLNFLLGELFSQAAINLAQKLGIPLEEVDLIGSHGQTVYHLPTPASFANYRVASTLQLGEPSIIAQRTGITTVADFRPRDLAAFGCGAPLAPYYHYVVFKDTRKNRVIINLGGIANLTYLPARGGLDDLIAFDTGPGNCLVDQLVRKLTQGQDNYDREGALAQIGQVDERLLARLLADPFVRHSPPKSTGPEHFNLKRLRLWPIKKGMKPEDLIATVTALTAHAIAFNIRSFIYPKGPVDEVIAGGGGIYNKALFTTLKVVLAPVHTHTFDDFGISSKSAEAQAFALLAYLTFKGRGGNLPSVTGAREQVPLGKIVPGRRPSRVVVELIKGRTRS